MAAIRNTARKLGALALVGALGLGGCAVQDGQPCLIRPDGSCVVLEPAPDRAGAYYDPDGDWTFVSEVDGASGPFSFNFVKANTLLDSYGVTWTYRGDNVWDGPYGWVLQLTSPDEGYLWVWNEETGDDEGYIYRQPDFVETYRKP
jgi:hypothetical protein